MVMNLREYLRNLKEEKNILQKNLAFTQTVEKRDFLFKRLLKVTVEIERVKNEIRNTYKPSNQKKS